MKKLLIILLINSLFLLTGCASTCMEYRTATTAARSEKNLKRAEEWGLKALDSPECNPSMDGQAPYFLATEVYLKQKKYKEMAEMLTLAADRNPDQPLENPFKLGDTPVKTIGEGVQAYRDQEWAKIYNYAVDLIKHEKVEKAKEQIEIAVLLHPAKSENYSTLAAIHMNNNNTEKALAIADRGIAANNESSILYQLKADIFSQSGEYLKAKENYLMSIEHSDDPGPIRRKLLFVYIDLGENQKAIDESNILLDRYPNDPDLYYNVGVLYQRLAKDIQLYQRLTLEIFDPSREQFLVTTAESGADTITNLYQNFKTSRQYAYNSRDYFLQASDLELEGNLSTKDAVSEMKKLMKQIDDLFIPSLRETAREAGIELN